MEELWKLSVAEAVERLRAGSVTPLQLVEAARARWEATDPIVNAMPAPITCWEAARAAARELQERGWPSPPPPGYLYGLPVAVKDVTAVAGVRFTEGSRLFEGRIAAQDDPLVKRLKERGAIIIGKTNTPEFAAGSHTFNEVFGVTRNPWAPALSAGGSSGGSAAALAVGSAWLATGTDLGGSLRNPAGWCGVVGLRPSPGLVPMAPPLSPPPPAAERLVSVAGPMARDVRGVALMLDAMAAGPQGGGKHGGGEQGGGCGGPAASGGPSGDGAGAGRAMGPYEAAVVEAQRAAPLRPALRAAFSADLGGAAPVEPEIAEACRSAAAWFSQSGSAPGLPEACPDFRDARRAFRVLRAVACRDMPGLLRHPGAAELFKPDVLWQIEEVRRLDPSDVEWAERAHDALLASRDAFFSQYDLLITPSAPMAPFPVETQWPSECAGVKFETYVDWLLTAGAVSLLGGPAVALPCGLTAGGLPIGLAIAGPPGSEARVLAAAAAFEAAHDFAGRVPRDPASMA